MNHLVNKSMSNNQEQEQKNVEDIEEQVIIIFVLVITYFNKILNRTIARTRTNFYNLRTFLSVAA